MSISWQGCLVRGDADAVRSVFGSLQSRYALRLCRLSEQLLGIYPVRTNRGSWDLQELERIAGQLSTELGLALSYYYNSIAGEYIGLFAQGQLSRKFTDQADAVWVRTDGKGKPMLTGPECRHNERPEDLSCVYLRSPLDAALEALGAEGVSLDGDDIQGAFFMGGRSWICEHSAKG